MKCRSRLSAGVARRARALAALNAVAATVSRSLDLSTTLRESLETALEVMKVDGGGIYLLDAARGLLRIAVHRGMSDALVAQIDGLRVGEGFSGLAVQNGQPVVVPDMAADPRLTRLAVVEAGLRSVAVVPLASKGRVLGTLFLVARGPRQFGAHDVELLTSIGCQIGVAIDTARLYEETKSRLAQLSALQETNRALVSTLELDVLLKLIIQAAVTLLKADGGILNLADWTKREDEVVACVGSTSNVLGERAPLEAGLSGWVTLHPQPVIANRLREDPRVDPAVLERFSGIPLRTAALAPLIVKDRAIGTLVVIDKLGGAGEFDAADLGLLAAFANQAATAIENARLYSAERRRAEQFRAIAEVSRQLTLGLDIDAVLQQVVRVIQETFRHYHVGIGLVEDGELVYRFGAGPLWDDPSFDFKPARLKLGQEGLGGWVAGRGQPLLVPDVSQDPRYVWMQGSATRSELVVPILVKERVVGVLDAQSDRVRAFDETDLEVMQSLAHQIGALIENARLYGQSRQVAVMEERSRLARELHDAVTQTLFSASLIAESLPSVWANDPRAGSQLLLELRALTRGALAEMRTLLLELRPAALLEARLDDLLRQLAEAAGGREALQVSVLVEGDFDGRRQAQVPAEVHIALYRIAQEALNNVVKHARASQASVRLCLSCADADHLRQPLSVLLSIGDNGRGFDAAEVRHDRLGLGIMHERAEAIGASLTIESHPGEGTQVTVLWEPGES